MNSRKEDISLLGNLLSGNPTVHIAFSTIFFVSVGMTQETLIRCSIDFPVQSLKDFHIPPQIT